MPATTSAGAEISNEPTVYRGLAALAWIHFVNDGASNILPGALPAILIALHKSPALAGALMSALIIGQSLQPLTGWLSQRVGPAKVLLVGVCGTTIGGALIGWVPNFTLLLLLVAFIGLANACFHPPAVAAARGFAGRRSGFGLSVMLVGGETGRGLWPLLASVVIVGLGLHRLWIPAACGLVTVPFLWRAMPKLPVARVPQRIVWNGKKLSVALLLLWAGMRGVIIFGSVTYLPILWHQTHGGLVAAASLIMLLLLVGIIGNVSGGHLADVLGRRRVLMASALACSLCLLGVIELHGALLWVSVALLGIALFSTLPVTVLIGQDLFPENRSMGSGVAMGLANAVAAALLVGVGLASDWISVHGVFWILFGVALALAPLALILRVGPFQVRSPGKSG